MNKAKAHSIFAPAKINLYLHLTGRRDDGYHLLDSLIAFADIGDELTIRSASEFGFEVTGPFAERFSAAERDASPDSSNLVVRAAWALARAAGKAPDVHITLNKVLPLAAGIGGGSSDAAAAIWGLMKLWSIPESAPYLPDVMAELGADVPVCLNCQSARMQGIGEVIEPLAQLPEMPALLVNPLEPCATPEVFLRTGKAFKPAVSKDLSALTTKTELLDFLQQQENDLTPAAMEITPVIGDVLGALERSQGCALARMSGSGATCFGLFDSTESCQKAADHLRGDHPGWWIKAGTLGAPSRY